MLRLKCNQTHNGLSDLNMRIFHCTSLISTYSTILSNQVKQTT
uniref:Uncharacterized protein n=1 Tax=Anguilla anguilla TaxID=7936 RepID=A0A0E9XSA4_ANGAN